MKPPAFQMYAADFYVDVADWSNEEIGIYFRLLMCEWVNGPLENDPVRLARIASCGTKKFQKTFSKIRTKFIQNGSGFLINERLEKTREVQDNYRKSQQEAGRRGAQKRWEGDGDPNGDPIDNPNDQNIALQSPTLKKEKYIKRNSTETILLGEGIKEVLDLLNENRNELAGKNLKGYTSDKLIKKRFNGGNTVFELCRVIELKARHVKAKKHDLLYYTPQTLFGDRHFEEYLGQADLEKA